MFSFAIYRLPYEDSCTLLIQENGEPSELYSYNELSGKEGFVIAPFSLSAEDPILLLHPDRSEKMLLKDSISVMNESIFAERDTEKEKERYIIDFDNFHSQINENEFSKIVLSRCSIENSYDPISPEDLFERACYLYPRMFVALVHTEQSGTWLTASPEILLEGSERHWRTIALAGTMKLEGRQLDFDEKSETISKETIRWSDKDREEQRFVAAYITECLEQYSQNVAEEGPITVRAGNLVHLRSNFDFTLPKTSELGDLINTLHPTPAVCGIPKDKARRFIIDNEYIPRHYYSGLMGPLYPEREKHLYVSLRCMKIDDAKYELYAGGGLIRESEMESEWKETESKMETMRKCLVIKKI